MYENEIIQIIEKLDDNAKKEIFDFAVLVDKKYEFYKTGNNIDDEIKIKKIAGVFKKYSKPELIEHETNIAWNLHIKQKFAKKL